MAAQAHSAEQEKIAKAHGAKANTAPAPQENIVEECEFNSNFISFIVAEKERGISMRAAIEKARLSFRTKGGLINAVKKITIIYTEKSLPNWTPEEAFNESFAACIKSNS